MPSPPRRALRLAAGLAALALLAPAAGARAQPLDVPLLVQEALPDDPGLPDYQMLPGLARQQEPVTFGLPLPAAAGITGPGALGLRGATAAQFRVLARWPSGAAQWVLVDALADVPAGGQNLDLALIGGVGSFGGPDLAADQGTTIRIDTGAAQLTVRKQGFNLLDEVVVGGVAVVAAGGAGGIELVGDDGTLHRAALDGAATVAIEENGPVRAVVVARGTLRSAGGAPNLAFTARLHFVRGTARVKVVVTLRNASLGQVANVRFRALELVLPTALAQPAYRFRTHLGEAMGSLPPGASARLFHGESSFPNFRDYDFLDFDGAGNPITTKYPTGISGYTLRHSDGTLLASGTRTQWIDLLYAQASAGGRAVTFGTRFGAGWWPQGLAVEGDGTLRVGLFPPGNDRPYVARFAGHVTRETLFDFAAPVPAEAFFRFQYPLAGKPRDPHWINQSGALWEVVLPVEEEAAAYKARGLPWQGLLDRRPQLSIYRHYYWGTGGGDNQYDFTKIDLHNWLRRGGEHAGGHWLAAEQRLAYNADLAVYHSDDWDAADPTSPRPEDLPDAGLVPLAKAIFEGEHRHAYGLGLYYYLSGDERIREAYVDWGDWLHHFQAAGFNSWERGLVWNVYNLVDLYRFTGEARHRDLAWQFFRDEVLDRTAVLGQSRGTDWTRGFYASQAATFESGTTPWPERFLTSFVYAAMFPRSYAYLHDFGGRDEIEADRVRGALEGIVRFVAHEHWYEYAATVEDFGLPYAQSLDQPRNPPDARQEPNWWSGFKEGWLTFFYGYLLTGDTEFLRRGEMLQRAAAVNPQGWTYFQDWPDRQRLQHLLDHPGDYAVWHDLPLAVEEEGGGGYTLRFTPPAGAERLWIRWADRPIVPWLHFDRVARQFALPPASFRAFFAAADLAGEPAPGPAGSVQSWSVGGLPAGAQFAARVLVGPAAAASGPLDFYTLAPCRLADTRDPVGPRGGPALAAGARRALPVAGVCGVPAEARAVSLNLTVVNPAAGGHLTLFGSVLPPATSTLNFAPGQTRANNAVVGLAADGSLAVVCGSLGAAHLVLDVNGYFR